MNVAASIGAPRPIGSAVVRALDVLADPWSFLILREGFFGVRRFGDFQRNLAISRKSLTARLANLTEMQILEKQLYCERPPRFEYRLTERGMDFYPSILMLMQWGDRHRAGADGPPLTLFHKDCGAPLHAEVVCDHCRRPLVAADVDIPESWSGVSDGTDVPLTRRHADAELFSRGRPCSVARTLAVTGDRWSMRIIHAGLAGTRRFDDFLKRTGIARNILSERLAMLVEEGLLAQRRYTTKPLRFEYLLTAAGADLYPAMLMLMNWGRKWRSEADADAYSTVHRPCGQPLAPSIVCMNCHGPVHARNVRYQVHYDLASFEAVA